MYSCPSLSRPQSGQRSLPAPAGSFANPEPSALTVYKSKSPSRSLANTKVSPSGDQAGSRSCPASFVTLTSAASAISSA